ncbi:hypothetical protein EV383_5673 [Pseudonocardia sediminis]|uniref:Uncharacterized protein n=1 Tax=Pseudonocardia sediminis TaxID=1397368 RepID=A0A4Q7V4W0_PSEST|nr:STM3941 family protein [Pseudonocardia sediminis]RZT88728.1 hypothetical protein EV383_5673 [Pseudonocardia sediminis]
MTEQPGPATAVDARPPLLRQVLTLLVAVLFLVAGIALTTGPLLALPVGVLAILFFAPVAVYQLAQLVRGRPRVVVDDAGIVDHASPAGMGRLGWDRVTGARVEPFDEKSSLVVVEVTDPDALVRDSGTLLRRTRQSSLERFGSPVVVPVRGLGVDADVLCRAILERVAGS